MNRLLSVALAVASIVAWDGAFAYNERIGGSGLKDATAYGVKCDGTTHDSIALQAALNAANGIQLPAKSNCLVTGITLGSQQTLDCAQSVLTADTPSPLALWVVKKQGNYSAVQNCIVNDPTYLNKVSTTLSGAVAAGSFVIPLSAPGGFLCGMPLIIQVSGAYFPTKAVKTNCLSAGNLTIVDPIPNVATAVAVVSGGVNCAASVDTPPANYRPSSLIMTGGTGVIPPTFKVLAGFVSGGVIQANGLSIQARGFVQTVPSNPVTLAPGASNANCIGATANITWGGALIGATVEGVFGEFVADQGGYGGFRNNAVENGTACFGFYSTTPLVSVLGYDVDDSNRCNGFQLFGLIVDANVEISTFTHFWMSGQPHGTSLFGAIGVYTDFTDPPSLVAGSGGNNFDNLTVGGAEIGIWAENANNLLIGQDVTADTSRDYGFICAGCNNVQFSANPWFAFTGPQSLSGLWGFGVNTVWTSWSSVGNLNTPVNVVSISGLRGGASAADAFFADWAGDGTGYGASVSWGCNQNSTLFGFWPVGQLGAINKLCSTLAGNTGGVVAVGSGFFVGNGAGSSTTEANVASPLNSQATFVKLHAHSTAAPTTGTAYIITLYDWTNFTASTATPITCTIPTGLFDCTYQGPAPYIVQKDDLLDFKVTATGSPPSAQFLITAGAE